MTKFVLGKDVTSFDMTATNIGAAEITSSHTVSFTDTACTASTGGVAQFFKGTGFGNPDPVTDAPRDGIINEWSVNILGADIYTMSKFNLTWADFHAFTESGDTTAFNEEMFGGKDVIVGSKGNDIMFALAGNDKMDGGKGDDDLRGDAGNDQITGGLGKDLLEGGGGADRFIYTGLNDSAAGANHDTIADFARNQGDKIDLEGIDADVIQGGNQAFHLGGGAFNNEAGELIVFNDGSGHRVIQGDVNGDGTADFEIYLDGTPNVKAADFFL
jgi:hypothetical protein